jgi:RND family efflux transporter MFP subunit
MRQQSLKKLLEKSDFMRDSSFHKISRMALFGTLTLLGTTACKQESAPASLAMPVRVAPVRNITIGSGVTYSASIVPYAQVDLSFKSNGYVDKIRQVRSPSGGMRNIDPGDWVEKGTVLAVVHQQDYIDKLQQAKAQLTRAKAEQQKDKLSFDRVSTLYAAKSATKPDYDSANAQLESTTASVSGAEAQVSEGQIALAYCSLQAPFNAWVVKRNVDVGSLVGPATNGFTLSDTRSVKAVFGVPDTSIRRVKAGQRLMISTDALPHPVSGRVSAISPSADQKSRVFSVEVSIPNPKNEMKSGMIASLTLNGEQLPQSVMAVPLSAVVRDPGRENSFAVLMADGDGGSPVARLRPVELGDTYGNLIAVKGGLAPGERVITSGATLVKSGDKVRVIE